MSSKCLTLMIAGLFLCGLGCESRQQKIARLLSNADAARENKQYAQAIKDYTEAINLNPEFAPAYPARAGIYILTAQYERALRDLDTGIRLAPTNALALEMRGMVYTQTKRYNAALTNFNLALKLRPSDVRVLKQRAQAFALSKDYTNAILDLTRAAELAPNDPGIYSYRGRLFTLADMTNNALDDFNEALDLKAEDFPALFGRAELEVKTGVYQKGARDFERALELRPDYPAAYNGYAWLLATCPDEQVRDGKKAVELANKACALSNWTNYAAVDTLAAAYAETGDYEQAVRYQKQAVGMEVPKDNLTNVANRIDLYQRHQPYRMSGKRYD